MGLIRDLVLSIVLLSTMNSFRRYLSHCLSVQLAIIHRDTMNTSNTVPGHMVMSVFSTNLVLKLIRFRAPMLRDDASVNSLLCSSITRQMRYSRKNIGSDSGTSYGTHRVSSFPCLLASLVLHSK